MELSLWLEPSEDDRPAIHDLVHACARIAQCPEFPAHVTLASSNGEPTRTLLSEAIGGLARASLKLVFGGVGFGDEYFYSAFLPIETAPPLTELRERAARLLDAAPLVHPPHLSLCYGALEQRARREIEALTRAAPSGARFDRLSLWDTSGDVDSFRELARCQLP
jgi:2'-5' RNA ligase superfamily protein